MGVLYLFLAVPGLCCWVWAFSSCREQGYSFVAVVSLSPLWVLLLWSKALAYVASVVVVHGLSCLAVCEVSFLVSFQARDQTCVPCVGRWILNHWTIRKSKLKLIFFSFFLTVPYGVQDPSSLTRGQTCDSYSGISVHITQLGPTLCDSMDCSTPDLPVHHQLLELAQTHVHWVSDAILCRPILLLQSFPASGSF